MIFVYGSRIVTVEILSYGSQNWQRLRDLRMVHIIVMVGISFMVFLAHTPYALAMFNPRREIH